MTHQPTRFGAVAQGFHWITALLVAATFALGPEDVDDLVPGQDFSFQLHQTLGLLVFSVTLLRVLWLFADRRPEPVPMARWMHVASKASMGLLYLLLLAVPATAILGTWLEGDALNLVAGLHIAPLLSASKDFGEEILDLHKLLADGIVWLAGLHAVAAIYHQYVLKDRVLLTMLPRWMMGERQP